MANRDSWPFMVTLEGADYAEAFEDVVTLLVPSSDPLPGEPQEPAQVVLSEELTPEAYVQWLSEELPEDLSTLAALVSAALGRAALEGEKK